jgi:ribonuclease HI
MELEDVEHQAYLDKLHNFILGLKPSKVKPEPGPASSDKTVVYTDGSYSATTKRGYWGVASEGGELIVSGQEDESSSNRAEILGLLAALAIPEARVIHTDSQYAWSIYLRKFNKITTNQDLVDRLQDPALAGKQVIWIRRRFNGTVDKFVRKIRQLDEGMQKHAMEEHAETTQEV